MSKETHTIQSNGEAITVPKDYILVRRDFFDDLHKMFCWFEKVLDKQDFDPKDPDQRPMIFLRAEVHDQVYFGERRPESLHTSKLWWSESCYDGTPDDDEG